MPEPPAVDGAGDLVEDLARWLAEARVDDAAGSRARERWLRQQAEEEASFSGVLLDLAERRTPIVAHGISDRRHRGTIGAVGLDFCVLRTAGGRDVLLAHRALAVVRPQPRQSAVSGDRVLTVDRTLGEALVGLAGERPRVLVVTVTGDQVAGDLRTAGRDVLTVRPDGDPPTTVYVARDAVAEVTVG